VYQQQELLLRVLQCQAVLRSQLPLRQNHGKLSYNFSLSTLLWMTYALYGDEHHRI
jgi:hypothetical protein